VAERGSGGALIRSWSWALATVLYVILLLSTLSRAPVVWNDWLFPRIRPDVTLWFVGVGAFAVLLLVAVALRAGPRNRISAIGVLMTVAGTYVFLLAIYYRGDAPAKKFHLLEYGALAILAFGSIDFSERVRRRLAAVLGFVAAVGISDEVIQGILPNRTFRYHDIIGNLIGALLGGLAWWAASRWSPWRRPQP